MNRRRVRSLFLLWLIYLPFTEGTPSRTITYRFGFSHGFKSRGALIGVEWKTDAPVIRFLWVSGADPASDFFGGIGSKAAGLKNLHRADYQSEKRILTIKLNLGTWLRPQIRLNFEARRTQAGYLLREIDHLSPGDLYYLLRNSDREARARQATLGWVPGEKSPRRIGFGDFASSDPTSPAEEFCPSRLFRSRQEG